jgi:hypothetical protein
VISATVSTQSPPNSELDFQPQLSELTREFLEVDPADGRLRDEGG